MVHRCVVLASLAPLFLVVILASPANAALQIRVYASGAANQAPGAVSNPDADNYSTDVDFAYGPGNTSSGEYVITSPAGDGPPLNTIQYLFKTFCLELDETFAVNTVYDIYNISKIAYEGGLNVPNFPDDVTAPFPGGDTISKATAWLYEQYVTDALDLADLDGDTLEDDFQYSNGSWAVALQSVIWKLEQEHNPIYTAGSQADLLYTYVTSTVFGSEANAMSDDLGSNVGAMNLALGGTLKQSMLIYQPGEIPPVPEPSTMLIWGLGVAAAFAVRRSRVR